MGLDSQLKRFFPLVLCALIGIVAYFQASGIGQLVASSVVDGAPAPPAQAAPPMGPWKPTKSKSGKPILARNPFDSVTGPLDGRSTPVPEATMPSDPSESSDEDPSCGFGRVTLISANADPAWSFASIEDDKGERALRRIGDPVGSHTVQAMGWDRVWLEDGSKKRCQLKLGEKGKVKPKKGNKSSAKKKTRKRSRGAKLSPELAAKINKVSDTEFNVERSVVDEILENQATLMRSARIVPEKDGDTVVGIKLYGIRSGTLLHTLGLKNGDRLESINGFEMSDPQKALEAYGRLRTANSLKVKVNRKGSPMTIEFNIQ